MVDFGYTLPVYVRGTVVKGFGRGSAEIGIRTANLDAEAVKRYGLLLKPGIYAGFCTVSSYKGVFKCVVNVGWCPYYNNQDMSIEAHIIHLFDPLLFYGHKIKIVFLSYIREEKNFVSINDLILAIQNDIQVANSLLNEKFASYKNCSFLNESL